MCLANSQTSLATLTALEATQIRSHVTTQVQQLEQLRLADRQYDKVSNFRSVSFPFEKFFLIAVFKLFYKVPTIALRLSLGR